SAGAEQLQALADAIAMLRRVGLSRRRVAPWRLRHSVGGRGLRLAGLAWLARNAPSRDGHGNTLQLVQENSFRLRRHKMMRPCGCVRAYIGTLAENCPNGQEIRGSGPAREGPEPKTNAAFRAA